MAIDIGVSQATNIANKHEEGSTGPAAEKSMDLFNNSIGRSYGVAQGTFAGSLTACKNAANSGVLRTLI